MARAARLHFEFGLTHQETAEALGLSRIKVTRLLKQARDTGLVQITVSSDVGLFADVESRLAEAFALREAIVVPAGSQHADQRSMIAKGAAVYLQRVLRDDMVVAMGLSRTIAQIPACLVHPRAVRAKFVSMVGSLREGGPGSGSPYEAIQALAVAFGGTAAHLHAPVIVKSVSVAEELMHDPAIAKTLDQAARSDLAFVGVGGNNDRIDLTASAYVTMTEWKALLKAGMAGDIGGRFFNSRGIPIPGELDNRLVGLTLDQFRKIPTRVVAAGGPDKVQALVAVLQGGLATVLVTDVATARAALRSSDASSTSSERAG
jgi:DNA-binding transcriptional regulator LsrR (DeoR family)